MAVQTALARLKGTHKNRGRIKSGDRGGGSVQRAQKINTPIEPEYADEMGYWDIDTILPMGEGWMDSDEEARDQPRKHFDPVKMEKLKASIKEHGQLKPILLFWGPPVVMGGPPVPRIWEGERRWRVMKELGEKRIKGVMLDANARKAFRLAVIADAQDEKWNGPERGNAILTLQHDMQQELAEYLDARPATGPNNKLAAADFERMITDFESTPEWIRAILERSTRTKHKPRVVWDDVAEMVGITKRMVTELVRLAGLPEDIIAQIEAGEINDKHARAIATLDSEGQQRKLARTIVSKKLTSEQAQAEARKLSRSPRVAGPDPVAKILQPAVKAVAQFAKAAGDLSQEQQVSAKKELDLLERHVRAAREAIG